jgi:Fe-S cluster biogenesis protein NfuA
MTQEIKISAEPIDPETCNFTVDRPVLAGGSAFFSDMDRAADSPLAEKLLSLEGVESILVQDHSVKVNAQPQNNWMPLAKEVGATIRLVLQSGQPPISESVNASMPPAEEISKKIQALFEKEINPAIASHGGFVELIDVKGNEVFIRLGGGCQGCGMANMTLKNGIEKAIRAAIPEVGAIMDTTDHATGRNPYYQSS